MLVSMKQSNALKTIQMVQYMQFYYAKMPYQKTTTVAELAASAATDFHFKHFFKISQHVQLPQVFKLHIVLFLFSVTNMQQLHDLRGLIKSDLYKIL